MISWPFSSGCTNLPISSPDDTESRPITPDLNLRVILILASLPGKIRGLASFVISRLRPSKGYSLGFLELIAAFEPPTQDGDSRSGIVIVMRITFAGRELRSGHRRDAGGLCRRDRPAGQRRRGLRDRRVPAAQPRRSNVVSRERPRLAAAIVECTEARSRVAVCEPCETRRLTSVAGHPRSRSCQSGRSRRGWRGGPARVPPARRCGGR